ncbi:MAG: nucleoside deaminase [Candidatus Pacebacteria bacterium]|nr:nucleoside deaminase [Candidatus Paceibacterota bacterium]MCF7862782.1 nucleoside deaminase [Candidatus Paceibacterota bacterium]
MNNFLQQAIELSKKSIEQGGFPVGALVVKDEVIISEGLSDGKNRKDATSHAEIEAIRNASIKLDTRDLKGCEVYSSMEPCLMCFSACYWAKITKIVYAVGKDKLSKQHYEGLHSIENINTENNRQIEIIHIKELENEALSLIQDWEKNLR